MSADDKSVDSGSLSEGSDVPARPKVLPVALDAMGSDKGPKVIVEGALQAAKDLDLSSILVGPKDELESLFDSFGVSKASNKELPIYIHHASQVIEMGDSPARAVRRKSDSSLAVAYNLLEQQKVSAMLSAGNSGAMMAAGRMICGLVPGIERPAIATIMPVPGDGRPNVILDTGANVDCHAQNLVQFAVMGSIYYNSLFGEDFPRVGLLSNGSEKSKGTDIIRAAASTLSQLGSINYIGFVEGRDATVDKVDVIVCDGFVGNVLLKASEGVVRLVYEQLMIEANSGLLGKIGLGFLKGALKRVFAQKFDYSAYGGSPLLGLNNLAFVLHGSSDARAVKNAVRTAHAFASCGMTQKITQEMIRLDEILVSGEGDELFTDMFSSGTVLSNTTVLSGNNKKKEK